MDVRDVMLPSPTPVTPDETVLVAAGRMKAEDLGCLLVGDDREIQGIVTDRDLVLRCMADGKTSWSTPVRDVMSTEIIICYDDEPAEDAVNRMSEFGVTRLPVFNRKGSLVGIITARESWQTVPMSSVAKRKPTKVTFSKEIASSHGNVHNVAVQSVYVSGAVDDEDAKAQAVARFQSDRGVQDWTAGADKVEVEKEGDSQ